MIIKQIKWEREFFHISSFNIHWIWVATGAFEKLIETTLLTETHRERERERELISGYVRIDYNVLTLYLTYNQISEIRMI